MKKINKEVQKIIKDFKIEPMILKEMRPISDEEFAKASFKFTLDLINYTRCCEELKCGDCDCKIKYPDIDCDELKDCKKDW